MKVKELILELQKVENQDAEVFTEGCDCYGEVDSLNTKTDGQCALMRPTEQET